MRRENLKTTKKIRYVCDLMLDRFGLSGQSLDGKMLNDDQPLNPVVNINMLSLSHKLKKSPSSLLK